MGRGLAGIGAVLLPVVAGAACASEPTASPRPCEPPVSLLQHIDFRPELTLRDGPAPVGGRLAFHSDREGRDKVFYVGLDSGRVTAATRGTDHHDVGPVWSRDGRQLAFATTRFDHRTFDLAVLDVADGNVRRVTTELADDLQPAWMPDGRSLIYASDPAGTQAVYRIDLAGASRSQVTSGPDRALSPDAAADGRMAWVAGTSCALRVFVGDGLGDDGRAISPDYLDAATPRWSPDGSRLAYTLIAGRQAWLAIHTLASGTIEHHRLAHGRQLREPTWSPDGRWIAAASAGGDGRDWDLVVLRAEEPDAAYRVTDGRANDLAPAWSPQ